MHRLMAAAEMVVEAALELLVRQSRLERDLEVGPGAFAVGKARFLEGRRGQQALPSCLSQDLPDPAEVPSFTAVHQQVAWVGLHLAA